MDRMFQVRNYPVVAVVNVVVIERRVVVVDYFSNSLRKVIDQMVEGVLTNSANLANSARMDVDED